MGSGGTAVLFFSKKRNFSSVEEQEDMIYDGALVRAPCPKRRMRTTLPQQSFLVVNGGKKPLERTGKNGYCKDGAVREQQRLCKIENR